MRNFIKTLVLLAAVLLPALAGGAGHNGVYATWHTAIWYHGEDELSSFEAGLSRGPRAFARTHGPDSRYLAERVDAIFEKVEFYLDMAPRGAIVNIELFGNRDELEKAYRSLLLKGEAPAAFYYHHTKTVYVNVDEAGIGMLAHELAHAIICAYFGVPPPSKTQEILAQYVDSRIREDF